jgi:folate-binding protein YgfZ
LKRIEHGIPAFRKEITDFTNPLECGLSRYVSFTKGCYIGQEVIARLDAYDKLSKHMVGIQSDSEIPSEGKLRNIKITSENKECGFVTSGSVSDKYGYIGLGFVKTVFLDYNKDYKIAANNSNINCKLLKLPFSTN